MIFKFKSFSGYCGFLAQIEMKIPEQKNKVSCLKKSDQRKLFFEQ